MLKEKAYLGFITGAYFQISTNVMGELFSIHFSIIICRKFLCLSKVFLAWKNVYGQTDKCVMVNDLQTSEFFYAPSSKSYFDWELFLSCHAIWFFIRSWAYFPFHLNSFLGIGCIFLKKALKDISQKLYSTQNSQNICLSTFSICIF